MATNLVGVFVEVALVRNVSVLVLDVLFDDVTKTLQHNLLTLGVHGGITVFLSEVLLEEKEVMKMNFLISQIYIYKEKDDALIVSYTLKAMKISSPCSFR